MAIANEFLKKAGTPPGLTQMQLQKLVYIAHGWNLAINEEPLASDDVQAWKFGPVFPALYNHTKYFGSKPIDRLIVPGDSDGVSFFFESDESEQPYKVDLSRDEKAVLDRVWERYGRYSAFKLSDLTHKPNTPWFITYFSTGESSPIETSIIQSHYEELAANAA